MSFRNLRHKIITSVLRRHGKDAFVMSLPQSATLLDVGCGNDSPLRVAQMRSDISYTGIDIGDYNVSSASKKSAHRYILADPDRFADAIRQIDHRVDAIISAHNLEHCHHPYDVVDAMASKLSASGSIYVAFPCAESVKFPSREGTLNFFDDKSHSAVIDLDRVMRILRLHGVETTFTKRRYRPILLAALGLVLEPYARVTSRNMPLGSSWALYGFESVVWGRKKSVSA